MNDESWKGEHFIRAPAKVVVPKPEPVRPLKRIRDSAYIKAANDGLNRNQAAHRIGCSYAAVQMAEKRLGLTFRRET